MVSTAFNVGIHVPTYSCLASWQMMAKLSGMELSKAALSHEPISRRGKQTWQLPDGPVSPYPSFPANADDALLVVAQTAVRDIVDLPISERSEVEGVCDLNRPGSASIFLGSSVL